MSNRDLGARAVNHAKEQYQFSVTDVETHDGESGSAWFEVKSTLKKLNDGSAGRFRLWKNQHNAMVNQDRKLGQTGWYVFVLYDGTHELPDRMRRVHATTVSKWVTGWNKSGHDKGRQYKLPIDRVF